MGALLLTFFPLAMPPLCACEMRQGVEDGLRALSYERTWNACTGGEMVRRFAREQEQEQYRATHPRGWR